jgi:hypothetical protein
MLRQGSKLMLLENSVEQIKDIDEESIDENSIEEIKLDEKERIRLNTAPGQKKTKKQKLLRNHILIFQNPMELLDKEK